LETQDLEETWVLVKEYPLESGGDSKNSILEKSKEYAKKVS